MAQDSRIDRLLKHVNVLRVVIAVLVLVIVAQAYVLIYSWDSFSLPARDLLLGIILDIVPALLAFIISYILLSRIQSIRSEHETDKQARKMADQLRTYLNFQRSPIRLESREGFPETLDNFIKDAKRVDMLGLSLLGTIQECMGTFRSMPADSIRFLMVNPKSRGTTTAWGSVEGMSPGLPDVSKDVETALNMVYPLVKSGQLTVKLTETAPSFSLTILDPDSDNGTVQVELYCYGIPPTDRPHFRLDSTDEPWHGFFIKQFDILWDDADDYVPPGQSTTKKTRGRPALVRTLHRALRKLRGMKP